MTLRELLLSATSRLQASGVETASLDAQLLVAHVLNISRETLLLTPEVLLKEDRIQLVDGLVLRRQQGEPIAYLIGKKEFWSLDFCVTPATLIPRSDSETLVAAALEIAQKMAAKRTQPVTMLDVGTGTGCLLIALLTELPSAEGTGVDQSETALLVAAENAKRLGVSERVQFLKSDWLSAVDGMFDLIISNPPYIAEPDFAGLMRDVRDYEPKGALVAGQDGLDAYRALAGQVPAQLNHGGFALFEVGAGQAADVEKLLAAQGLRVQETRKDLAGIARCVVAEKI